MAIDDATVRRIAALAQLEVEADALTDLRDELDAIVAHVARLQEVDVSGADPGGEAPGGPGSTRADEVRPSLRAEDALAPAAETFASLFRVPRVLSG